MIKEQIAIEGTANFASMISGLTGVGQSVRGFAGELKHSHEAMAKMEKGMSSIESVGLTLGTAMRAAVPILGLVTLGIEAVTMAMRLLSDETDDATKKADEWINKERERREEAQKSAKLKLVEQGYRLNLNEANIDARELRRLRDRGATEEQLQRYVAEHAIGRQLWVQSGAGETLESFKEMTSEQLRQRILIDPDLMKLVGMKELIQRKLKEEAASAKAIADLFTLSKAEEAATIQKIAIRRRQVIEPSIHDIKWEGAQDVAGIGRWADEDRAAAKAAEDRRKALEEQEAELAKLHGVTSELQNAFVSGLDAMMSGTESFGKAFQRTIAMSMRARGLEAAGMVIWEGAQAIAALAIHDYDGAAKHGKAAAGFAAASAFLLSGSALLGGGGGGGGGARPSAGGGFVGGGSVASAPVTNITVHVGEGFVGEPHKLAVEIHEKIRGAQRAQRIRDTGLVEFE